MGFGGGGGAQGFAARRSYGKGKSETRGGRRRRWAESWGPRQRHAADRIRETDSREAEISELCADHFSFGEDWRTDGQIIFVDRSSGTGAAAANRYAGVESLAEGRCGFAARDYA